MSLDKDLKKSLEHLKIYSCQLLRGLKNYGVSEETTEAYICDIQHAIDHVITDHCESA